MFSCTRAELKCSDDGRRSADDHPGFGGVQWSEQWMKADSYTRSVVTVTYRRTQTRGLTVAVALLVALCGGAARGQDAPQRNVVLVFVDDLHIDFGNTPRLRTGLQQATD